MSEPFDIEIIPHSDRAVVVRVSGWLGGRNAAALVERCPRACGPGQSLVLNLSGVSFITSVGVGSILTLAEEFHRTSRSVRVAPTSAPVFSVLRLLNLDKFLDLDPTEEAALEALEAA